MARFAYAAPPSLEDALALLRAHGAEARVLAGGQSLVPMLAYRLVRPRLVVDVSRLPLDGLEVANGRLRLGALVRYHQLEDTPLVRGHCPVLAEAAGLVGNLRVRALGTVGGSLAHADPAAELPMVMTALDARLTLRSSEGARTVSATEFFRGPLTTALAPDELLVAVEVPLAPTMGWAVEELSRRAGDFALVAVAAGLALDAHGRVEDVRVALAGVADRPVRARAAEDALRGHEPTAERLAEAARLVRETLAPASDAFASGAYRRVLAGVLTRRALARAAAQAREVAARGETAPGAAAADPGAGAATRGAPRPAAPPGSRADGHVRFVLNGRVHEVAARPDETLLALLRDGLGVFDVKEGCGEGVCGACTVLLDGRPVSSCLVLARSLEGRAVLTVRGLVADGALHPLQEAFVRAGAVQCGFCTPGMLLTAVAVLARQPRPSRAELRRALEGNLCRCTGYTKILDAIEACARASAGAGVPCGAGALAGAPGRAPADG